MDTETLRRFNELEGQIRGLSPHKIAEMERRMMSLEEVVGIMKDMLSELKENTRIHEAVCLERQKTIFNTIATLDTRMQGFGDKMETINVKLSGWQSSLIGFMALIIAGMLGYGLIHKLI